MKKRSAISLLKIFLGLALSFWMMACDQKSSLGKSTAEIVQTDNVASQRSLIQKADEIQENVVQGRILKSSSNRDKAGFLDSIRQARLALVLLAKDPNSRLGVQLGYESLKALDSLYILRGDQGIIHNFYKDLGEVITAAANRLNIKLEQLAWTQFSYTFSDDVAPFSTQTNGAVWSTGSALDESYIRIRGSGRKNESWLLSPSFDLRALQNPGFKISHNISADKNDRFPMDPFNRVLINKTLFKVLVSTNYKEGDKLIMSAWTDVSAQLGAWPTGVDFHTVESSVVDLTPFISENTTIAFVFNEDTPVIKRHYFSWQINRFELVGAGTLPKVQDRLSVLNLTAVGTNELSPFAEVKVAETSSPWSFFGINEFIKFAKIRSQGLVSDNWLVSPKYKIANVESAYLKINEVVLNPKFESMELFVSADYNGGDPRLSSWTPLQRTNTTVTDPTKWTILSQGPYDLAKYKNSEIVVGLRFRSQVEDKQEWELENLSFLGLGEAIAFQKYPITFPEPKAPVETSLPNFNFSHGNEGFTSETIAGTPASFELKARDGAQYFSISGFKSKNAGTVRLQSPTFKVKKTQKKVAIRLSQSFNYYGPNEQKNGELLKVFLKQGGQLNPLKFTKVPPGTNFDVVTSEDLILADSMLDGDLQLVFEYTSGNSVFPQWNLYQVLFVNSDL